LSASFFYAQPGAASVSLFSLHDALPIFGACSGLPLFPLVDGLCWAESAPPSPAMRRWHRFRMRRPRRRPLFDTILKRMATPQDRPGGRTGTAPRDASSCADTPTLTAHHRRVGVYVSWILTVTRP